VGSDIIDVTHVQVLRDRVVRLTFEDGEVREVDLAPLLWGPAFEALEDDEQFRRVRVDPTAGTIVWPNGADLSAHTLYQQGRRVETRHAG
jgi:hypothetical protein